MNVQRLASDVGQARRIALPVNPGSGASWYVDAAGAPVNVTLEKTLPESAVRRAASQVFLVVGDVPGDYELRFVLRRAMDSEVRNSRRVVLQVRKGLSISRVH